MKSRKKHNPEKEGQKSDEENKEIAKRTDTETENDTSPSAPGASPRIFGLDAYDALLGVVLLLVLIVYLSQITQFHGLASPVYGGDYYRDRGFVENILQGNPVWSDAFFYGELQYYPYFLSVILAGVVQVTGLPLDKVMNLYPLVTTVLACLVWFLLGYELFGEKKWAVLLGAAYLVFFPFVSPKSSDFAAAVVMPLFLLSWL
ncbi:hypothetical protein COY95_02780, partial [Candidatus Woesearchaeota archaeon CG_4_10_14_0_8_um_filter_47_5]